ncbi:hypothetical protein SNE40_015148 [Patella caerulea]|uniref:Band 7 domain-containing protein n=1 Tax=Patella caerulea TaxID=87958 RepID=A0AAN8JGD0_PATCE
MAVILNKSISVFILAAISLTVSHQTVVHYTTDFNDVKVYTADEIEISLDVQVQYRQNQWEDIIVDPRENPNLYQQIVNFTVVNALKGTGGLFQLIDYFQQRDVVEASFRDAIDLRFTGVCCGIGCINKNGECRQGCKPRDTCTTFDKGIYTLLDKFSLVDVHVPESIRRRIQQLLETEIIASTD